MESLTHADTFALHDERVAELVDLHEMLGLPSPPPPRQPWTRNQLVAKAKEAAAELEGPLTIHKFCRFAGISTPTIYNLFPGRWGELLREAELEAAPLGTKQKWSDEELLAEWNRLVRRLGRPPTWDEVTRLAEPSACTFKARLGNKSEIAKRHAAWVAGQPPARGDGRSYVRSSCALTTAASTSIDETMPTSVPTPSTTGTRCQ